MCDDCPVAKFAGLVCPGVHHPRYCELRKKDPGAYDPELVRMAREPIPLPPRVERDPPPLWKQAANFAVATAKDAASGFARVHEDTLHGRLAICRGCPQYRPSDGRCAACGCVLEEKVTRAVEACPEGRWDAVAPQAQGGRCCGG